MKIELGVFNKNMKSNSGTRSRPRLHAIGCWAPREYTVEIWTLWEEGLFLCDRQTLTIDWFNNCSRVGGNFHPEARRYVILSSTGGLVGQLERDPAGRRTLKERTE